MHRSRSTPLSAAGAQLSEKSALRPGRTYSRRMARGARQTDGVGGLLYGARRARTYDPPTSRPLYRIRPEFPPLLDQLDAQTCLELIKKYEPDSPVTFPTKFTRHRLLWVDPASPAIEHGWYKGQTVRWAVAVGRRRKRIPQSGKPPHCKYDDSLTLTTMSFRCDGPTIHQVHKRLNQKDDLEEAIDRAAREIFKDQHGYDPETYEIRPIRHEIAWSIAQTLHIVKPSYNGWEKLEEFEALEAELS
jgi:hypothetical protein